MKEAHRKVIPLFSFLPKAMERNFHKMNIAKMAVNAACCLQKASN
jgi:hypothetical protein